MHKKDDNEAPERADDLTPKKTNKKAQYRAPEVRASLISNMLCELEKLEPPGLAPIKQVEMYTKWRPLLKPCNQEITCPRPSEDVIQKVKNEQNAKARNKRGMDKKNESEQV